MNSKYTAKYSLNGKPRQLTLSVDSDKDIPSQFDSFLKSYYGFGKAIQVTKISKAKHSIDSRSGFGNPRHYNA